MFRGIAIAAMIVVNNPGNWGAVYAPLTHAAWNGWTAADLIFPAFVFVVGVTSALALRRRAERAGTRAALLHVATRASALAALGLLINLIAVAPHLERLRVPGVLQRIALAFALASPIILSTGIRVWAGAIVVLLVSHTVLLTAVPFGGHAAGTLTPAANLPGAVDARLFGPSHLHMPTMDPEGVVGTLTTAATLLCGAMAGRWLQLASAAHRGGTGLILGGVAAAAAGLAWAEWLPLNKSMWTGSFALASAGVAALALGACVLLVSPSDSAPQSAAWFTPFVWLGVNPLAIYVLSEVARQVMERSWSPGLPGSYAIKELLFWGVVAPVFGDGGGPASSLAFALAVTAAWIGFAGLLYRRGVRVRI